MSEISFIQPRNPFTSEYSIVNLVKSNVWIKGDRFEKQVWSRRIMGHNPGEVMA